MQISSLKLSKTIGILGGGQLARMLSESAARMGLNVVIFAEDDSSPAALISPKTVLGSPQDADRLRAFLKQVSWVIFESEFVPVQKIRAAAEGLEVQFFPPLACMEVLQNKLAQKNVMSETGVKTSEFITAFEGEEPSDFIDRAVGFLGSAVFKWAINGYDGKGVCVYETGSDRSTVEDFCRDAATRYIPLYAERKIDFARELALVSCVDTQGRFAHYPLVISEQKQGICHRVYGPAVSFGVSPALQLHAQDFAERIARELKLCGTFALELFETKSSEILVNEIAPRVHNSGHYTQNAAQTSQFENHLRAVLGLSLGSVACAPVFAMLNLLGPEDVSRFPNLLPHFSSKLHFHWYAKKEVKPRRKLGHVNAVGEDPKSLQELLLELDRFEKEWSGN